MSLRGCNCDVGFGTREKLNPTTNDKINDVKRVEYLSSYLDSLAIAIRYWCQTLKLLRVNDIMTEKQVNL